MLLSTTFHTLTYKLSDLASIHASCRSWKAHVARNKKLQLVWNRSRRNCDSHTFVLRISAFRFAARQARMAHYYRTESFAVNLELGKCTSRATCALRSFCFSSYLYISLSFFLPELCRSVFCLFRFFMCFLLFCFLFLYVLFSFFLSFFLPSFLPSFLLSFCLAVWLSVFLSSCQSVCLHISV